MPNSKKETLQGKEYIVLVAAQNKRDAPLVDLACDLARGKNGIVHVVAVSESDEPKLLPWLRDYQENDDISLNIVLHHHQKADQIILQEAKESKAEILVLGWSKQTSGGRYILSRTLDSVIQNASTDVLIAQRAYPDTPYNILIPVAGGQNAIRAIDIAHQMSPTAKITLLSVAARHLGQAAKTVGRERLANIANNFPDIKTDTKVVVADNPIDGILQEAENGHDLLIIGASAEHNIVNRFIFGNIPKSILQRSPIPAIVARRRIPFFRSAQQKLWTRLFNFLPTVSAAEPASAYKSIQKGIRHNIDYSLMLALGAAFASLGFLLDSPEIIVGAMMVSPLMASILGMSLNIILGESRNFLRALIMMIRGVIIAISMGILIGFIAPNPQVTHEILAFSQPSLLDLGIALIAGTTAAYAISRSNVSSAFAGVAVAAALTPPLANVGLTFVMGEFDLAQGAALLFTTNLVAIIAAGALVFIWLGFHPRYQDAEKTITLRRGLVGVVILLVLVTIPLAILTYQSTLSTRLNQNIETAIKAAVSEISGAKLESWELQNSPSSDETLQIDLILRGPSLINYSTARSLQEDIAGNLQRVVALTVSTIPSAELRAFVPPTPTDTPRPTPPPSARTAARLPLNHRAPPTASRPTPASRPRLTRTGSSRPPH